MLKVQQGHSNAIPLLQIPPLAIGQINEQLGQINAIAGFCFAHRAGEWYLQNEQFLTGWR